MKRTLVGLCALGFVLGTAVTQVEAAGIRRGHFNIGRTTYYSNGYGAVCQMAYYDPYQRTLVGYEREEFEYMRNDGPCRESYQYGLAEGPFNWQGASYYSNGWDAYCRYRNYNPSFRYLARSESDLFYRLRDDGYCQESYDNYHTSLREGPFDEGSYSYYSNGRGHYCQYYGYRKGYRRLSFFERDTFRRMVSDGYCRSY